MSAARLAALLVVLGVPACLPRPPAGTGGASFLQISWDNYKERYIHASGYVLDRTRGGGEVTSEGQSYALLRAAWLDDRTTFARVFAWTERTLARADGLYSWRWSPRNGSVLDANTATDADQDVALALIVAGTRFGEPAYLDRAARIIRATRTETGIPVAGGWFPSAGNWAVDERIVNLSYFAPYAYPYFARLDPDGRWLEVVEIGYGLLERTTAGGSARLPPDFMTVGPAGEIRELPESSTLSRRFSFDAARIPWRVELDCRLHQRRQACEATGGIPFLVDAMQGSRPHIVNAYDTDGAPRSQQESPSFYAALLPALARQQPASAAMVRRQQLGDTALMRLARRSDRYYDANWVWFGLALAEGWIPSHTPAPDRAEVPSLEPGARSLRGR